MMRHLNECISDALDFFDLRGLTLPFTQIVQLRAADFTVTNQVNMVNTGGIDRERTFHADPVRHPANSKGFADAAVTLGNHSAFESLQTFTVSFNNFHPDTYSIADVESRKIAANLLCFDGADNIIHGVRLLLF